MEKRGLVKTGIVCTLILACLISLFMITFSGALTTKDKYILGESVKIDLTGVGEYTLRITTPSTSYFTQGNGRSFAFKPIELGKYVVQVSSATGNKEYSFEVMDSNVTNEIPKLGDVINTSILMNQAENENHSTLFGSGVANFTINQKAVWHEFFNISANSNNVKLKFLHNTSEVKVYSLDKGKRELSGNVENDKSIIQGISSFFGASEVNNYISLNGTFGNVELEYNVSGPKSQERSRSENNKEIEVYSDDGINYSNVLTYINVSEAQYTNAVIQVYWKEGARNIDFQTQDTNNDGKIDLISWISPDSNNENFEIIIAATNAEHLDSNRSLISNIYDSVKSLDGIWSETIADGDYVRVTFEKNLTSNNDITLYAKSDSSADIEVYGGNSDEKIAEFYNISSSGKYRVLLINLKQPQDTFNLKIIGGSVSFDYIVDPTPTPITVGPRNGGNFTNDTTVGTVAWRNPRYANFSDNLEADTAAAIGQNVVTNYLKVQNFSFNIPTSATINGILVTAEKSASNANRIIDHRVFIVKNNVIGATNKANQTTWTVADVNATYGSLTDLWGLGWTAADINNVSFGMVIAANNTAVATATPQIDAIWITVNYTTNDTLLPAINITSPLNITYGAGNNTIYFNVTTDEPSKACNYTLDGGVTNDTMSNSSTIQWGDSNNTLPDGSYTAKFYCWDLNMNVNSTNVTFGKYIPVYPNFSNYWDNNGTLRGGGTALFNVTVMNTNGTVFLQINGTNYTASNITANVYNVSVITLLNGTYTYSWLSWGNSSLNNFNNSITRSYTINITNIATTLVSPASGATITDPLLLGFVYNVSDSLPIVNCSLIINGSIVQNSSIITTNLNQSFNQYMSNGVYNWSIRCIDSANNIGYSQNRTINISINPLAFSSRFYETYPTNYLTNTTAVIWLNNSRDATQNNVSFQISQYSMNETTYAYTPFMGNNGAFIAAGTPITFSSSFSAVNANIKITWKLFITNSSGNILLCQIGDDAAGGVAVSTATISGMNATCINKNIYLADHERLLLKIDAYNNALGTQTITHVWDGATSSYVDLNLSSEGFLNINLSSPSIAKNISSGQQLNVSCDVSCSQGFCRNTNVYLQYNTSSSNWTNVSSSGNIVLYSGETNPHNLGNISTTSIRTNFSIQGNLDSINNIRCVATSSYDSINSSIQNVSVFGFPQLQFYSPTPSSGSTINYDSIASNLNLTGQSITNIVWNWNGVNYTLDDPSLQLMFNFNNLSALGENSTFVADASPYSNNGTIIGGGFINNSGKYGASVQLTGNNYVSTNYVQTGVTQYTIAAWVKTTSSTGVIVQDRGSGAGLSITLAIDPLCGGGGCTGASAGVPSIGVDSDSIWQGMNGNKRVDDGNWHYIVGVFNSTSGQTVTYANFNIYIDGVLSNGAQGNQVGAPTSPLTGLGGTLIGYSTAWAQYLTSQLDELRIWNRSLSADEIYNQYISNLQKYNSTSWNFYTNRTTLANGLYTFYSTATNSYGLFNSSEVRNVTIDTTATTPPLISVIYPQTSFYNINSLSFNVSLDRTGNWCGYSLDGTTNVTMTKLNNTYFWKQSFVSEGLHSVIFFCNSTTGIMGNSSTVVFSVDTTAPSFTFNAPTPSDGTTINTKNVEINLTLTESNLKNFVWNWNGTNYTVFNDSTVVSYNFNNLSALGENSTFVADVSGHNNNGIAYGGATWNASGKYGGDYKFDGSTGYILSSQIPGLSPTGSWAYSFWVKTISYSNGAINDGAGTFFLDRADVSTPLVSIKAVNDGFALQTRYDDSSGLGGPIAANSIKLNTWQFVTVVREAGTAFRVYVDGVLNVSGADTGAALTPPQPKLGGHSTACPGTSCFNGYMDNFVIYNRSLSAAEILQSYLSSFDKITNSTWIYYVNKTNLSDGNYTYYAYANDFLNNSQTSALRSVRIRTDSFAPQINLNLPANNTAWNSSSINLNFTVIDPIDSSLYCNLTIGGKQDLNFQVQNGSLTNRLITGLMDGLNYWNVSCVNSGGNRNTSETRRVNITSYPTISLQTPNNTYFNSTSINLNYLPSDNTNLSQCRLYVNGVLNQTNQTAVLNGVQNNFSLTNLPQGNYNWSVSCTDYFSLVNQSETRLFSMYTAKPTITLLAPANGALLFDLNVYFNYTVIDNIDTNLSCNITINNVVRDSYYATNGSLTSRPILFTIGGGYFWNVTCTDHAGNTNISLTRNFTLAFPPIVNATYPPKNYYFNYSTINLSYNATSVNNNIANSTLILNGIINMTNQSGILNGDISKFTLTLPDGVYNWTVNVTDTTNLVGNTSSLNFTVDTHAPVIYTNLPTQDQVLNWNNLTFSFNVSDNLDKNLDCSLYINDALELGNIHAASGNTTVFYAIKSDGNYYYNIVCSDDAQNTNSSQKINFTVSAPPRVTLQSPLNGTFLNSSTVSFVYLPQDAIGIYNCSLYVDGLFNASSDTINVNQNNTFVVNGINEGVHNWTVACADAYPDFNIYSPAALNFSIDKTSPSVVLISPLNNTNILRTVNFNFTASDNMDANLTCNLYIDNSLNKSNISVLNGSVISVNVTRFSLGIHNWNVSCMDDAGNLNFSAKWQFNVTLADLSINSSSIIFGNSAPKENESVMINATVYNLANVSITSNFTIQFFLGDPTAGGQQFGSNITISYFAPLSSQTVSASLPSSGLGGNPIFVMVDTPLISNGTVEEWNETNNIANNTVTVSGWEFVYGNMNSINQFTLADSNSSTLKNWRVINYQSGEIYATDYDSSIQWTKLQALGRDTSNATIANDFTDLDSMLNMTSFSDSINSVYTNNTNTPLATDNFTIFGKTITNVPIAKSTNNTNFYTGILWDYSKDHNGQYDTSDKEDVIFVTKTNKQALGAYGTYDYELRIPAKLRNYRGPDATNVNFYTEIN